LHVALREFQIFEPDDACNFCREIDGNIDARRYRDELGNADVRDLAIHRGVGRLRYSSRCAKASAVEAHLKHGIPLASGIEIGCVAKDAKRWKVNSERTAPEFDAGYCVKLLERRGRRRRLYLIKVQLRIEYV
jgi:hypothetical protein